MRPLTPLLLAASLYVGGCGGAEDPGLDEEAPDEAPSSVATAPQDSQTLSLFGAPLYAPQLPADVQADYEAKLTDARADFVQYPDSALAWIWVGRREGYLGNYRRSVAQFTRGFEMNPEDARFLRHRGHRYITLRRFEDAISDLGRAATMVAGESDLVEPDGLPNARGIPTTTLQGNILYHLALAHYLSGDFEATVDAARRALVIRSSPDSDVAMRHWLYAALRREGKEEEAAAVLEPVTADMDIIENQSYHELLLMYKGELSPQDLLDDDDLTPAGSAQMYGVGAWYLYNGDQDQAVEIYRDMLASEQWAPFGYIAAEADMRRLGLRP